MSLIVMKFGGTSVGSAERIQQAARIILQTAAEHRVAVVVSALSGVTDLILKSVHAAGRGDATEMESRLQELEIRHDSVIESLLPEAARPEVAARVNEVLMQFRSYCSALLLLRAVTPQVLDVALPMGEKMSARLVVAALNQLGVPGVFVDSTQVLVTDERFGDATPDIEQTRHKAALTVQPLLEKGLVPVMMGFGGATATGQPTTLGRGGSDSSATVLGAALRADEVWIWTDVDGVLTADPRICPNARTLPEITFSEAIELSYYGAKVIHHKSIQPVMDAGIPTWIKNSFQPNVPGTRIDATIKPAAEPVKAVTAVTRATLMTLTARSGIPFAELFGRLFLRLGHENVDILFSTQSSSENSLGIVLRQADTERVVSAIQRLFRVELKHGMLQPIQVSGEVAVIAVLGESMKGVSGVLGRLFNAIASRNLSVIAVAQGASELNICFAVDASRASEAVRAVHDEFFRAQDAAMGL